MSLDENLIQLSFEKFSAMKIANGDIFWKKKSGKLVPVCFIGDRVDHAYLDKFSKMDALWMQVVGDSSFVDEAVEHLKKFKEANDEVEKIQSRNNFILFMKPCFWSEGGEGSLVDFIKIFQDVFYELSPEQEKYLEEKSMLIFKRSTLCAATTVMLAMGLGYNDFEFLKELYHVNFYMDVGIEKSQFTTTTMNVFEKERVFPGARNESLSKIEANIIETHAMSSIKETENEDAYKFAHIGIKRLIKFHHERLLGDGFPRGLNLDELSDLEKIIIMVFQNITYEEIKFVKGDGEQFLKQFIGTAEQGECDARIENHINQLFEMGA